VQIKLGLGSALNGQQAGGADAQEQTPQYTETATANVFVL